MGIQNDMQRLTSNCTELRASLFTRRLLHISARKCHPQEASRFLSELLQRQYGRRHEMESMV
jgi:hypothetical protein